MAWDTNLTGAHLNIASMQSSPLRVLAGPGTGKTFAMMRRIARLLEQQTLPTDILAVSFTRTAAKDLVRQLKALGVPGADLVGASTLHSVAFKLLGQNAVFMATGRVPRPLLQYEQSCLVADLSRNFGGRTSVRKLLRAFEAYWAVLQHQAPGWPTDPIEQEFDRELHHWLTYHGAMLLGELIPLALDYVLRNPTSPNAPSYKHVLVDEYQDLNRADQEFVDALARSGTLTVIGDEDQSIYTSLRHAHPEGITEFHQTHANTVDEALSECRRCPITVVTLANALILRNHPSRPSTLVPSVGAPSGNAYVVQHASTTEEVSSSAAFIDWYLRNTPGVVPGDVLVLATRRLLGYALREELPRLGHPAQSFFTEEALDKLSSQEGFCLLILLAKPNDRAALRGWLGIDVETKRTPAYERVWSGAQQHAMAPAEFLDAVLLGNMQRPSYSGDLPQRYADFKTRLPVLMALSVPDLVDALWPAGSDNEEIRGLALAVAASCQTPAELLEELTAAIVQPELPGPDDGVVRIMSLHKSKGLTARCVLVLGCVAGALPSLNAYLTPEQTQNAIKEQRRLFYVAVTRTTETLVISSAATAPFGDAKAMGLLTSRFSGGNAVLQASPFISDLGPSAPKAISGKQWHAQLGF